MIEFQGKDTPNAWSTEEVRKLFYELQTHQIELEMQNEELRKAHAELELSRDRYSDLYDFAPVGYFTLSEKGLIVEANLTLAEMLCVERRFLLKSPLSKFIVEKDQDVYYLHHRRLQETKERQTCELQMRGKTGEEFWARLECVLMEDSEGRSLGIRSVMIDVTERKRSEEEKRDLEDQLRQAQKMEAIGTLAGGIAHDFNNILGIIMGNCELALKDVPDWNPAHYNLEEVSKAAVRARDMVKQILAFSRRTEQQVKPVHMGPLVKESLKMLRVSIPSTIEIREELSMDKDTVRADPAQINQVILNLCTNAAHAMREKGGVISVCLKSRTLEEDATAVHPDLAPGAYLDLAVSDTGHGMDQEVVERIFDPFFTTKETGEGTGMGLSVVHGIVKNHGGAILVESEPGESTVFHIYLPLIEVEAEQAEETVKPFPIGTERILFVDDVEALAELGERMIEHLQYKVTASTSSIEALDLFREDPGRFDLVITDMTMPHMTGADLSLELLRIRPGIPIILCTGYSEMISEEKAVKMGIRAFVNKPFSMRDLAETIRKVLDQEKK